MARVSVSLMTSATGQYSSPASSSSWLLWFFCCLPSCTYCQLFHVNVQGKHPARACSDAAGNRRQKQVKYSGVLKGEWICSDPRLP